MQKLCDLLGLPVLTVQTGTRIGEIQEILLDIDRFVVHGIVIINSEWFGAEKFIRFSDLLSIGQDAVMVRKNSDSIIVPKQSSSLIGAFYFKDLKNKPIMTESGIQLGILSDIFFNQFTGEIKAYRVSEGLLTDLFNGLKLMPVPQVQVIGKENIIVPEKMLKLIQNGFDNAM